MEEETPTIITATKIKIQHTSLSTKDEQKDYENRMQAYNLSRNGGGGNNNNKGGNNNNKGGNNVNAVSNSSLRSVSSGSASSSVPSLESPSINSSSECETAESSPQTPQLEFSLNHWLKEYQKDKNSITGNGINNNVQRQRQRRDSESSIYSINNVIIECGDLPNGLCKLNAEEYKRELLMC